MTTKIQCTHPHLYKRMNANTTHINIFEDKPSSHDMHLVINKNVIYHLKYNIIKL